MSRVYRRAEQTDYKSSRKGAAQRDQIALFQAERAPVHEKEDESRNQNHGKAYEGHSETAVADIHLRRDEGDAIGDEHLIAERRRGKLFRVFRLMAFCREKQPEIGGRTRSGSQSENEPGIGNGVLCPADDRIEIRKQPAERGKRGAKDRAFYQAALRQKGKAFRQKEEKGEAGNDDPCQHKYDPVAHRIGARVQKRIDAVQQDPYAERGKKQGYVGRKSEQILR